MDQTVPDPQSTPLIRITHDLLHDAIETRNISRVLSLLNDETLRPCYRNPIENCFTIAQTKSNPEVLKLLLENCGVGRNAIYSNGDTLLMKDIRDYRFRNFTLLTESVELDVNRYNLDGLTALHFATLISNTPSAMIKKLIELKADVNKKIRYLREYTTDKNILHELRDATPLICLLRNFDPNYDGFEKVQLLVSNGALVNVEAKNGRTPLMYAAGIKVNVSSSIGLIKYLFDNGAVAGLVSDLNENALVFLMSTLKNLKFSEQETELLIKNYYIKLIDLFIEMGDDPFIGSHKIGSIFYGFINSYDNNKYLKTLILYFAKKQIEILSERKINPKDLCGNYQAHPLEAMVKCFPSLVTDQELLEEILQLIILCPINEFKVFVPATCNTRIQITEKLQWRLPRFDMFYTGAKYHNVSSVVVKYVSLNKLEKYLELLRDNQFHFNGDELCLLLVRNIIEKEEDGKILIQLVDYFIRNGEIFKKNFSKGILNLPPILHTTRQTVDVPDSAWLAALSGNITLLKTFFPYCVSNPLSILLLMHPCIEKGDKELSMLNTIEIIFPTLSSARELDEDLKILIENYMDKIRFRAYGLNRISPQKQTVYARIFASYLNYRNNGFKQINS